MRYRLLSAALVAALALAGPTLAPSAASAGTAGPRDLIGGLTSALASTADGLLRDSLPTWAHGAHTAVPGSDTLTFVVQLPTRDQAGLDQLAKDVNDPSSPRYHHYLTPQQYAEDYAPTSQDVSAARGALDELGLSVKSATAHGTALVVTGPLSAIGSAFGTTFGAFEHQGASLIAPLKTPTVPSSLQGLVANVAGLSQEFVQPASGAISPQGTPDGATVGTPCSSYFGEKTASDQPSYEGASASYNPCGYTGKQLRSAYGLDSTGLTGKGASIGIVDAWASGTAEQDANQLATDQGDAPFADGQFTENIPVGLQQVPDASGIPGIAQLGDLQDQFADALDTNLAPIIDADPTGLLATVDELAHTNVASLLGGLIGPDGWAQEEELDIEAVHAMAPDANVVYQGSVTPYPDLMYAAMGTLIEDGQVQVISNSYGTADDDPLPTDLALFDAMATEAAATGVTLAFATGDSGDNSQTGVRTPGFPATDDQVLAVGGTSAQIDSDGTLAGETYWGGDATSPTADGTAWDYSTTHFSSGGGGGVSTSFAEPDYQRGVVPQDLATYGGVSAGRVLPDVSLDADPTTGMQVGNTMRWADGTTHYGEYRVGGTSQSTPLMAGVLALAIQAGGGAPLGEVNPTLYAAASGSGGLASVFNDPSPVSVDPATKTSTLGVVRTDHTVEDDPSSPSSVVHLITLGNLQTLHALSGYDDSTGLGTPKAGPLVHLLVPGWTPPAG